MRHNDAGAILLPETLPRVVSHPSSVPEGVIHLDDPRFEQSSLSHCINTSLPTAAAAEADDRDAASQADLQQLTASEPDSAEPDTVLNSFSDISNDTVIHDVLGELVSDAEAQSDNAAVRDLMDELVSEAAAHAECERISSQAQAQAVDLVLEELVSSAMTAAGAAHAELITLLAADTATASPVESSSSIAVDVQSAQTQVAVTGQATVSETCASQPLVCLGSTAAGATCSDTSSTGTVSWGEDSPTTAQLQGADSIAAIADAQVELLRREMAALSHNIDFELNKVKPD